MWILLVWLMITHHLQQQIINIDGLIDSLEKYPVVYLNGLRTIYSKAI